MPKDLEYLGPSRDELSPLGGDNLVLRRLGRDELPSLGGDNSMIVKPSKDRLSPQEGIIC